MPEIKETFELLRNYVNELPIGLLLFDPSKKLVSWNKYAIGIFECSEENFKKNNLGILANQVDGALSNEQAHDFDLIGLMKPLKAKKAILESKYIVLVISEALTESLGETSHELRRPITNIKTLTESLLLGAKNEPEIAQKFLEQINNEVDRLTKLVNDLLNLSKVRSAKVSHTKKKIKLKAKVDDAIKLLQTSADKNKIKLINETPDNYEIFADPEQIDHVIQNLIENAIKYSTEGATVTVKTGPVPGSFQVDDTGIGIPEGEIPRIFNRFYRVNRQSAKGSSGLGLSIVKNVIDIHGGKIEVKSRQGSGSSFIIFLPID